MKYRLKPEIAKRVCEYFGVAEAQLKAAQVDFLLVPKQSEEEGFVFESAYLLMLPVRGHLEQVAFTRDEIDVEEDDK